MGAVLTPAFVGIERAAHLPNASTFCGRCESVCPMRIPLPKMMRHWREQEFERHLTPKRYRAGLQLWAWFARHPGWYRLFAGPGMFFLSLFGGFRRRYRNLPFAGEWTRYRDFAAPQGRTFMAKWPAYKRRRQRATRKKK
jgi:L-lactate dehydrogenase complex protein LldF